MKKKFWIGLVGAVCVLGIVVSLFGMAQRPSYIYMVRHGRTYANEQGLLMGGDGNADLTPEAVEQAKTKEETPKKRRRKEFRKMKSR